MNKAIIVKNSVKVRLNKPGIASQKLFSVFKKFKNRPFIFVEPRGNFGDQLLFMGAQKLAYQVGLNFENKNYDQFMNLKVSPKTAVYIHGGGSFNALWNHSAKELFERALVVHKGVIILGPQTFTTDKEFLKKCISEKLIGHTLSRIYIFSREKTSYNVLKSILPSEVNILFDHDTALNLSKNDFSQYKLNNNYVLYAIREDKERKSFNLPHPFVLSLDPINYCQSFEEWIKLHCSAKEIITNRLHSSILGSILGKPTTLLPNVYFKNHAVWEVSLNQRGINWQEEIVQNKFFQLLYKIKLYKRLVKSYKIKNYMPVFLGINWK